MKKLLYLIFQIVASNTFSFYWCKGIKSIQSEGDKGNNPKLYNL